MCTAPLLMTHGNLLCCAATPHTTSTASRLQTHDLQVPPLNSKPTEGNIIHANCCLSPQALQYGTTVERRAALAEVPLAGVLLGRDVRLLRAASQPRPPQQASKEGHAVGPTGSGC